MEQDFLKASKIIGILARILGIIIPLLLGVTFLVLVERKVMVPCNIKRVLM
jgi:hypothetical protein